MTVSPIPLRRWLRSGVERSLVVIKAILSSADTCQCHIKSDEWEIEFNDVLTGDDIAFLRSNTVIQEVLSRQRPPSRSETLSSHLVLFANVSEPLVLSDLFANVVSYSFFWYCYSFDPFDSTPCGFG